jgi:hypothetical protein
MTVSPPPCLKRDFDVTTADYGSLVVKVSILFSMFNRCSHPFKLYKRAYHETFQRPRGVGKEPTAWPCINIEVRPGKNLLRFPGKPLLALSPHLHSFLL